MEQRSFYDRGRSNIVARVARAIWINSGQSSSPRQVDGVSVPAQSEAHRLRTRAGDLLSSFVPIWRGIPFVVSNVRARQAFAAADQEVEMRMEVIANRHPELFGPLGLSKGLFLATTRLLTTFSVGERFKWSVGRLVMPWIYAGLLQAVFHVTPLAALDQNVRHWMGSESHRYWASRFFEDVQDQVGPLDHRQLLIAYDPEFFDSIPTLTPNPVESVLSLSRLSGGKVVSVPIRSSADLAQVDLRSYDDVIIFTHGSPDSLAIGWQDAKKVGQLKQGANLIFLSCLVGEKGASAMGEAWTDFSKMVLDGGKAVASIKTLYVKLAVARREPLAPQAPVAERLARVIVKIDELSGMIEVFRFAQDLAEMQNQYYFYPNGIRVYDSKTNAVTYVQSSTKGAAY